MNLTPVPSPKRDDLPSSPLPLSLDSPSPPTLNLALPEERSRRQEEENTVDSDNVFSDVDIEVSDIGEEEKWKEEKSSDIEEERSLPEGRSLDKSIKALEDFARGITNCFSKLPEDKCKLCEKGREDLKYYPIRRKDRVSALEALALKMLEWKKPDEALKQREYEEGYDSLARERHDAMKYHGLDVKYEDEESD
jgi:hypothetical protein